MVYSIGLDKFKSFIYIHYMKPQTVRMQTYRSSDKYEQSQKSEFIRFVGGQFKQLTRRNLGLQMKLYNL